MSALIEKIEAVKKVSKALKAEQAAPEIERVAPNKEQFQTLLEKDQAQTMATQKKVEAPAAIEQSNQSTLMDEVKKLNGKVERVSKLDPTDLKNQTRAAIDQIDQVKTQLANTQSEIKPSYQNVLRNRLTHIDENLKIALSKAGAETAPVASTGTTPTASVSKLNPIERFLGYLTQGQYQLEHLNKLVDQLNASNAQLTPANMLAIQIKVSQVQQEIELFTSLLNKALESTKTIMNVQV